MVKFSEMPKGSSIEDADYIPFVDSSETNPSAQNKTILYGSLKKDLTDNGTEATRAKAAEAQLSKSIQAETDRATKAEKALSNSLAEQLAKMDFLGLSIKDGKIQQTITVAG